MQKNNLMRKKEHFLKRGLAFALSFGMFFHGFSQGFIRSTRVHDVYASEVVATSSNAVLSDGELENDLILGEGITSDGGMYSDTMYENRIVFTGLESKVFVPGEEIDLLEGVSATIPGLNYHITVRVVELSDSNGRQYTNRVKFLVPETENVRYSITYMAYIQQEELERIGKVKIATPGNASTAFRASNAAIATSAGLPVGSIVHLAAINIANGPDRLQVDNTSDLDDNPATIEHIKYTYQTIAGKITVNAADSDNDLPGAYFLLRVPTKHLDMKVLNTYTGERAGLRINQSTLIQNNTIQYYTEIINGEEFLVAKVKFQNLLRTTSGDLVYQVKFADSRRVPANYVLQSEAEFFNGSDQSIGKSPKADFQTKYDTQSIKKYVMSNDAEQFALDNQLLYGGATVNDVIQESTAIAIPFKFNMPSKEKGSFSMANNIYRLRMFEKIVLEDTLPIYTNELTGEANFPAVFDAAANPGWVASEWDASGRPTKVRKEVVSQSEDTIHGGADAVLRDDVVLNLKFPGLNTNKKTTSGIRTSLDETNQIKATLIPYNASVEELADPTYVVSDNLVFNITPNESGSGMLGKSHLENTISIENGFMHLDTKGANFIVNFVNRRSTPTTTFSLYDFKADPRTYYKEIEFRSNESDVGGDKVVAIWGIDAGKNRVVQIYDRATGPVLPAGTGVDPYARNVQRVKLPLDTAVTNQVATMVADVEAGVIMDTATTPVPRTFDGIEVVYDAPVPPYAVASFRMHLGFRDPYNVRINNPDNLIENSAAFKAEYADMTTPLEAEVQRNLTRLIPLNEAINFQKVTVANATGNLREMPLYRINFFFTTLANSRKLRNPKLIEVLPYGMEYVGLHEPIDAKIHVNRVETISNYKDSGRTAVIIHLDDIDVGTFPVDTLGRKFFQVQVRGKIVDGMFPDTAATLDANRNYVYFMADGLYPLSSSVNVQSNVNTATAPSDAKYGMFDDIYDIDNNPNTTKVLGASSATKVAVGGQIVSYKQIRNKNGDWIPSRSINTAAVDGIVTRFDEEFDYRIVTENMTTGSNSGYAIYDILPYAQVPPYNGTPTPRPSVFRNRMQGPLVPDANTDANDYDFMYSINPTPNPNSVAAMTDPAMGWKTEAQITNWEDVTAFKIQLKAGRVLRNGVVVRFTAPMKAPSMPTNPAELQNLYLKKAINVFQVSYNFDTASKAFASSNFVFNQLGRNIPVKKLWSGADPNTPVTVQLKQDGTPFTSDLYPNGQITLVPNADPNKHYSGMFERVPVSNGDGHLYRYTLEEIGVGTGALANYTPVY